jgi:hypothetical protein
MLTLLIQPQEENTDIRVWCSNPPLNGVRSTPNQIWMTIEQNVKYMRTYMSNLTSHASTLQVDGNSYKTCPKCLGSIKIESDPCKHTPSSTVCDICIACASLTYHQCSICTQASSKCSVQPLRLCCTCKLHYVHLCPKCNYFDIPLRCYLCMTRTHVCLSKCSRGCVEKLKCRQNTQSVKPILSASYTRKHLDSYWFVDTSK